MRDRTLLACLSLFLLVLSGAPAPTTAGESAVHTRTNYSRTYEVDQIYRSMQGPKGRQKVLLRQTKEPELLWITGFRSEIVGDQDSTMASPEFKIQW